MLHEYRKKTTIKAEQFDGSDEMMEKYNITDDGFGDTYTFRLDSKCLPLKCGWWIVDCGKLTVLDYTFGNWKTMSDEDFRRTYERCD
jgi:hypothetical protein|nr:MAG TPA: hypothetical protein [Caudoviricetes sp.]